MKVFRLMASDEFPLFQISFLINAELGMVQFGCGLATHTDFIHEVQDGGS
jgi:hypothetical protein